MSESSSNPAQGSPSRQRWLVFLPIVAGVVLLLVAMCLVVYFVLFRETGGTGEPGIPLPVTKIAVTPVSPTSTPPPQAPTSCETIITSGDVAIAASLPMSLTVGSGVFPVEPVISEAEGWSYPADSSGSAAWMCGTVVNYIIVLEPTAENETLLAGLTPGEEITLRLSNGATLFFGFSQQQAMGAAEMGSVFAQFEPRLTLLLEQQAGTWLVVTADYVTSIEPYPPSPDVLAQLNVPVRVGDAQVTVFEGYALRSAPDLPAGTMYYLVEFSVENVGATPLNADFFTVQLQDSLGNKYLLSSAASAFGESGLIEGKIAPGEVVEGSAGYLVPDTLAGPMLVWTFSPSSGSEIWASVGIPYAGEKVPAEPARAEVFITDALIGKDESTLIVEGEIQNVGGSPLVVEARDITLSSSGGMGKLIMAAPPLPWTIEPGETRVIELQFERPDAPSVLLMLLGYSFEISGLE